MTLLNRREPLCDGCGLPAGARYATVRVFEDLKPRPVRTLLLCPTCMTLRSLGIHPKLPGEIDGDE